MIRIVTRSYLVGVQVSIHVPDIMSHVHGISWGEAVSNYTACLEILSPAEFTEYSPPSPTHLTSFQSDVSYS